MSDVMTGRDWSAWQASWDRRQVWYIPDREDRFRVMLDMVEATVGHEPRVLDLACGTGTITRRFRAESNVHISRDPVEPGRREQHAHHSGQARGNRNRVQAVKGIAQDELAVCPSAKERQAAYQVADNAPPAMA